MQTRSALPFYLVIVPLVVVLLQFAFLERAVEFSRNRAIQNSAPLIGAIEDYRVANGRYPRLAPCCVARLFAVRRRHQAVLLRTSRRGLQPLLRAVPYRFGTQEFVMYNPRDEHAMTSHAMDLLEFTPAQFAIERTRGHYARNDAPQPHWKYFWFD